ncbi:MAG TPA: hypothetical protein VGX21_06315 [Methylomirabilota bacterium]|nr:hypothetical protein [Methylomirabilota bacterium]
MSAGGPAAPSPPVISRDPAAIPARPAVKPPPGPTPPRTLGREVAVVFGLFTLLGLLYTAPLPAYFSTGIPYVRFPAPGAEVKWMQPGDSLQLYYWFWLMRDNLAGGSRLFTNPYEFDVTPVLPPQRYGFYQFPLSLLFVVFSALGGAAAYNAMIVLSFPLAAVAMYLLVRLYTDHRGAALVGALIFALAPFRLAQLLGGHSNGLLVFLLPLIVYGYEMGLRRRGLTFGTLAGLGLVSLALSDFHLLYYVVLFSAGYWAIRGVEALELPWASGLPLLLRAARAPRVLAPPGMIGAIVGGVVAHTLLRRGAPLRDVLLAGAAALVATGALWLLAGVLILARKSPLGHPTTPAEALRRAAVTVTPLAVVAGYGLPGMAGRPGTGRLLLALAVLGVALFQGRHWLELARDRWARMRGLLAVLLPVAVAILLSVGYVLLLRSTVMGGSFTATGGRPYALIARNAPALADLVVPRNLDDERAIYPGVLPVLLAVAGLARWRRDAAARGTLLVYGAGFLLALALSLGPSLDRVLPLYRLAYTYLPFFNYPRSPGRLMVLTFLALAVLAGYALRGLPRRPWWAAGAFLVVAVGIGIDYAPFRPIGITRLDPANPLYATVGREVGDGRFLAIPLFPGDSHQSSVYQFYVTTSHAHMVNGYNPLVSRDYVEAIFDRLINLNVGEIRPAEYELLKALRVKFLVVHEELFFWKVSPFPGALTTANLRASPYLAWRGRAGDQSLFAVRDAPAGEPQRFAHASVIGALHELEESGRRTGREVADPDASGGRAVEADEGRDGAGYLAFGTAPFYPSGTYVAGFRLKLAGPPPPGIVSVVDVSTERGRQTLARREIAGGDFRRPGAYEEFDLRWSLAAPARVELRVRYEGRGRLLADRVYVAFAEESRPRPVYEAEDLLRQTGEVGADADASGGYAVHARAGTPESYATFGPYRRYPPGRYEAVFRVRLDGPSSDAEPLAVVDVSGDRGRRQFAARPVMAAALAPAGRYHDLTLPFTVDEPAVLEFRVLHRGRAGLWIDRVTVRPGGATR